MIEFSAHLDEYSFSGSALQHIPQIDPPSQPYQHGHSQGNDDPSNGNVGGLPDALGIPYSHETDQDMRLAEIA